MREGWETVQTGPWCVPGTHACCPFLGGAVVKNPPASAGQTADSVQSLGREDPLEKEVVTHSSILA